MNSVRRALVHQVIKPWFKLNWTWWHMPATTALQKGRKVGKMFKVIFDYLESLRTAWATCDPVSKQNETRNVCSSQAYDSL